MPHTQASYGKAPEGMELVLKVVPMPRDCNANGDIFGGWVMARIDQAGSVLATRVGKGRMVTVAVNDIVFKQPVGVGDILSFYAVVRKIGNTSVTLDVEVYAEPFLAQGKFLKVTEAMLTFVAITEEGLPRPVPKD